LLLSSSSIPTITELLTARESPAHGPPPPYCEASFYRATKSAVTNADHCGDSGDGSSEAGSVSAPPPSYDEAIKSALTDGHKLRDQNKASSRTYANPVDVA